MRLGTAAMTLVAALILAAAAHAQTSTRNVEKPKITMKQAQETALAKERGTIKSSELEKEHGRLIYSFDIQTSDGIHEVNVDAMNGKVVEDTIESAADEAKEARQEKKADRVHKTTPKKQ